MVVIGLSAKKKCGKSTVSDILVSRIPNCERIAIADFIRKECSKIFNLPYDVFVNQDVKELYFETPLGLCSPRKIMQFWGEFRRKERSSIYWIEKVYEYIRITRNTSKTKTFIVDDIRLKFEADFFKQKFCHYDERFYMIRIDPYEGYDIVDTHITENDMDNYKKYDMRLAPGFGIDQLEWVANMTMNNFIKQAGVVE